MISSDIMLQRIQTGIEYVGVNSNLFCSIFVNISARVLRNEFIYRFVQHDILIVGLFFINDLGFQRSFFEFC